MDLAFARRHAGTLALAVLAVAAVALYLVFDQGTVSSREATRRQGQLLPAWRRNDITLLDLTRGGEHLRLERDAVPDAGELDYRMTAPDAGSELDAEAVSRFLTALEFAKFERKLEAPPEAFGAVMVRVQIEMGKLAYTFELGGEAAVPEGAHYLRLSNAAGAAADVVGVYVVPSELVSELQVPLWEFRSKQIVPYLSIALASLEIERPSAPPLRLERIDPVSFRIQENHLRASRVRIDRIWQALADSRIEYFPGALPVDTAPKVTVRMHPEQGEPATLTYGGACPDKPELIVVARAGRAPLVGCVPASVLEGFAITAADLTDQGLFALHLDELEELRATRGDESFELAREGASFRRRSPEPVLLEGGAASSLETALRFLFEVRGNAAAGQPAFSAEASFRVVGGHGVPGGSGLTEEIELGTCNGVSACVHRKGDGAFVGVGARDLARLRPALAWMNDGALGAPEERAARVQLACGAPQTLRQEGVGYVYETPPGAPIDHARALELVDRLRRVRAAGVLAPGPAVDVGFGSCTLRAWPSVDGGAPFALELGAETASGLRFARVLGKSEIVLVDAELGAAAARVYLDRTFWNSEQPIEHLRITVDKGSRVFVRDADAAYQPALGLFESLRADEVLHVGPPLPAERLQTPWLTAEARAGEHVRQLTVQKSEHGAVARIRGIDATYQLDAERMQAIERALQAAPDGGP